MEFALAGGLGYLVIRFLARRLGAAPISWKRLVFGLALFVAGCFATGIFVEDRVVTGVTLIGLSASGFFYYTYRDLWFVPSWLPFLWVLAAGVFVDGWLSCRE